MVHLHYMLIQPHYIMKVPHYTMGYYLYGSLSKKNGAIQKGKTKQINCPFFFFLMG